MLENFFLYLYPLLSIPCVVGYLPQIKEFITTKEAPKGFAVTGWIIWLGENMVTLGYGIFTLKDLAFSLMTALDLLFIIATIGFALYNKNVRFAKVAGNADVETVTA